MDNVLNKYVIENKRLVIAGIAIHMLAALFCLLQLFRAFHHQLTSESLKKWYIVLAIYLVYAVYPCALFFRKLVCCDVLVRDGILYDAG